MSGRVTPVDVLAAVVVVVSVQEVTSPLFEALVKHAASVPASGLPRHEPRR